MSHQTIYMYKYFKTEFAICFLSIHIQMVSNKQVHYTGIPTTYPEEGKHMKVVETFIDLDAELPDGDVILKTLEISVDPYMRGRMRDPTTESYIPAFELNQPMTGDTMSVVVKSNNKDYKIGDLVYGRTGCGRFEEYPQITAEVASAYYVVRNDAKENGLPLSNYVGVLAMPGFTAYVGLHHVGKPKYGETVYVSAASGAVGQLVGQFAKALGCYVAGSASTDNKVAYLKSIGFDAAFNYKDSDFEENLKTHCPNGIDVYYDNVGGKMLDAVLKVANNYARIVGCGMVSQYNLTEPTPIYNLGYIVSKRIKFDGFIITDHMNLEGQFLREVTDLLVTGKVKYLESTSNGIESLPQALIGVLKGENFGKQVVHVADL